MTDEQTLDMRVRMTLSGEPPIQCHTLAERLGRNSFDTRQSLLRLMKSKEVAEKRTKDGIFYSKVQGGNTPPEAA